MNSLMGCQVQLQFGFEDLQGKDFMTKSDPFAVIEILDERSGKWKLVGQTKVVKDTHTGSWTDVFKVTYVFEERQTFRVRMWDYDDSTSHDFLGEASFRLGDVMASPGQRSVVASNKGKGRLKVYATKVVGDSDGRLLFKLRAHKLDSKDWGGFGRSDPYFVIEKSMGANEWVAVYKSEYHDSNNSPIWNDCLISMQSLCGPDSRLRIRVYDYDDGSQDDLIGDAYVSVSQLLEREARFDVVHPPTRSKYQAKKYKRSGELEVLLAVIQRPPIEKMLEYIAGGLQINLTVAIDFTASNGSPSDPRSLHFRGGAALNQYQSAIQTIGSIISSYDHDGNIPVFGFGGMYRNAVSHCFPLNFNEHNPEVRGVGGVLDIYNSSLSQVPLSGPTYFAPLLTTINRMIYNPEMSQQSQSYNILLILTDGEIMDMQATIAAIRASSEVPLSIVIVGVGGADFSKMEALDGDDKAIAPRDIVQFVPFTRIGFDPHALAAETLCEIPKQLVEYFEKRNIRPNPPLHPTGHVVASVEVPSPVVATAVSLASSGRDLLRQAYEF